MAAFSGAASLTCSALQTLEDDERFWANAISRNTNACGMFGDGYLCSPVQTSSDAESTDTPTSFASTFESICTVEHSTGNGRLAIQDTQALAPSMLSNVVFTVSQQEDNVKPLSSVPVEAAVARVGSQASSTGSGETFSRKITSFASVIFAHLFSSETRENAPHDDAGLAGLYGSGIGPWETQSVCQEVASTVDVARNGKMSSARTHFMVDPVSMLPSTPDMMAPCCPAVWPTCTTAFCKVDVGDVSDDERSWLTPSSKCRLRHEDHY